MPLAYPLGKSHIPALPIPISRFNEEYTTTKYRMSRRSLKAQASPKNRISASPRTLRCPLYTSYNPTSPQARYVLVSVRLRDHLYNGYLRDRVANPRYTFRLYPSPTSADNFSEAIHFSIPLMMLIPTKVRRRQCAIGNCILTDTNAHIPYSSKSRKLTARGRIVC